MSVSDPRTCEHRRAGYTDPTGGDPFMGGPVLIRICLDCGYQLPEEATQD